MWIFVIETHVLLRVASQHSQSSTSHVLLGFYHSTVTPRPQQYIITCHLLIGSFGQESQIGELDPDHNSNRRHSSNHFLSPRYYSHDNHYGTTHPIQSSPRSPPTILLPRRTCPPHERESLLPQWRRLHNHNRKWHPSMQVQRKGHVNQR